MRMLSQSELEAVCGGQDPGHAYSGEIVIPGYPPGGGSYWPGGAGGGSGYGGGAGGCDTWDCSGEGGGSSPPPTFYYDYSRCEQEVTLDAVAGFIEHAIKSQADWNEREYSALIYVDHNGNINIGVLTRGETVAEATVAGRLAPETRLTIPSDALQIVGIVHNHPDIGYDAVGDLYNQSPSSNDWGVITALDQRNLYNPQLFNQYIIDAAGHVRQFTVGDISEFNGDTSGPPPQPRPEHEVGANTGC